MSRLFGLILIVLAACSRNAATSTSGGCDESIEMPPGFCATVFSDSAGFARHMVVRKNGDVLVGTLDQRRQPGGVLVLRDANKDGHADAAEQFGESGVHGLALSGDTTLFVSTASEVIRYRLSDSLLPKKKVDTVVLGLTKRPIPSHSLALDARGNLLVNIGAASNGCAANEVPNAPGRDPCPELETSGGIWSFRTDRSNQTLKDGVRIATGLHNAVALTVNPHDQLIYGVSHDRDRLHDLWPSLYTAEQNATLPAEEMFRIAATKSDFGWPYCYYDYLKGVRVLAPEYAGAKQTAVTTQPAIKQLPAGKKQTASNTQPGGRCDRLIQPLVAFPPHWSPMSILFYTGAMFPPAYRSGAFIAFHGSSDRAPLPEEGYHIVFLQFSNGMPGDYQVFAKGFAGGMMSPEGAAHRVVGLAQGPDGALYVSDDKAGRIWKITYKPK